MNKFWKRIIPIVDQCKPKKRVTSQEEPYNEPIIDKEIQDRRKALLEMEEQVKLNKKIIDKEIKIIDKEIQDKKQNEKLSKNQLSDLKNKIGLDIFKQKFGFK